MTPRRPSTPTGQDLADGERDGLTALIVQIEDEARVDERRVTVGRIGDAIKREGNETTMGGPAIDGQPMRSVVRIRSSALAAILAEEAAR